MQHGSILAAELTKPATRHIVTRIFLPARAAKMNASCIPTSWEAAIRVAHHMKVTTKFELMN
jgi:hypothetical protein